MSFSAFTVTRDAGVLDVALTGRGALGPDFWQELPEALSPQELGGVGAVVLRGSGPDFSVGLDLHRTAPQLAALQGDREGFLALVAGMQRAVETVAALPVPTVAALHGWCIGAGLELAAACDLRVCDAGARFSLPEVRLGIVADLGGLSRLPRLVGEGWTRQLALTGRPIDAARAERIGLVTEVLATPDETLAHAHALARELATLPAAALRGTKHVLNAAAPHERSLDLAARWNAEHLDPRLVQDALRK